MIVCAYKNACLQIMCMHKIFNNMLSILWFIGNLFFSYMLSFCLILKLCLCNVNEQLIPYWLSFLLRRMIPVRVKGIVVVLCINRS